MLSFFKQAYLFQKQNFAELYYFDLNSLDACFFAKKDKIHTK